MIAKATGARKITSKLNAHLEPLNLTQVRIVHKNNFQIIDALTISRFEAKVLPLLHFIKEMTYEGQSDYQLWTTLKQALQLQQLSYTPLLKILGFDPQFALCDNCQSKPYCFDSEDLCFWCAACSPPTNSKIILEHA